MTLFALPMSVLGGYGKDFVEGLGSERPVLDLLEREYGEDVKSWVKMVMGAADHYAAIQQVLHKIKEDTQLSLGNMLGGTAYDTLDILADTQYPLSHITPLMATTHPDSVTTRHALLGPYKSVAAPALPATFPPQRQDVQTLIDIVAAIATKEDRREVEK